MPSDRPLPEPPAPGSDPAGRRRATGAVRDGTLVFALVLGGFVAYALGAPATYRASAVVAVEPVPGAPPADLPKSADGAERLRRAALDPAVVGSLASEERPVAPDSLAQASARISSSLSVESKDGRRFTFSATASSPERAQRIVNELTQQAAKRAAQLLDPTPTQAPDPGAKAKAELFDFLAAHPGIASEPAPAPTRPGPDPLVLALRAERARIESKLAQPEEQSSSDNPYDETLSKHQLEDPEFLKRRMREIDKALDARSKPKPPEEGVSGSSPEVRAEWQRLLRAVSEAPKVDSAPAPRVRVTLARAALPNLPVQPDRPKLVLIGILVSSIIGVLAGFLRGTLESRAYRRYGTGTNPVVPLPQTTLRIPKNQLPRPIAPVFEPPPTPVPDAPVNVAPMTPIPPAPIVPHPITPIPPAPVAAVPITPMPVSPIGSALITPIPPAAKLAPPALSSTAPPTPVMRNEPSLPARDPALAAKEPAAPGESPQEPSPFKESSPPPKYDAPLVPVPPIVVAGPAPIADGDGPPATLPYPHPEPTPDPKGAPQARGERRVTQIYGTPPSPTDAYQDAKTNRTTQAYGSPPEPTRKGAVPFNPTPFPAEVLPPYRNSLRPSPMIPLAHSSSVPPAVAPSNRSGAPLVETGYSYVRTPVPEAHSIPQTPHPRQPPPDSIPQTPYPRKPSPPPRTEPYGSIPPVQAKRSSSAPPTPDPNRPNTPNPPAPELPKRAASVVRKHSVLSNWRPDATLSPQRRREIAGEILAIPVNGCRVVGVTGIRGLGSEKSRTAVEIALALAEAKQPRVLLVEGDFHFPELQNWMKLEVPLSAGFSQQLRARIHGGKEGRWHVVECTQSLHVLAEGVMRSPGLLLSNQFEQAMRELRSYYDTIVLDAPLAPNDAEAQALRDVLDATLVVGSFKRASEVAEIKRLFESDKLLRVVEV